MFHKRAPRWLAAIVKRAVSPMVTSAGMVAPRRLQFVPAQSAPGATRHAGSPGVVVSRSADAKQSGAVAKGKAADGLFDQELVKRYQRWRQVRRVGPGFYNDGNSCYLNATLQCLLYLPTFVQLLLHEKDALDRRTVSRPVQGPRPVLDLLQSLAAEVHSPGSGPARALSPRGMVASIRRVGKQFKPLRQEDAHEYLRQLLDHLHEESIKGLGVKSTDPKAETSFIHRIFGGKLVNTLACNRCGYVSRTYNSCLDLSLDLQGAQSVQQAIAAFTRSEKLTQGNEWRCDGCKEKVCAVKQMAVAHAPQVLVLHLKRFAPLLFYGSKITKPISFTGTLDVPFQGEAVKGKVTYELTGVVEHHGHSTHSGHYLAYVKAPNGTWCVMDDNEVSTVSLSTVLKAQAYVLFYSRVDAAAPVSAANPSVPVARVAPQLAKEVKKKVEEVGEVVKRSELSVPTTKPLAPKTTAAVQEMAAMVAGPENDEDGPLKCRLPPRSLFFGTIRYNGLLRKRFLDRRLKVGLLPLRTHHLPERSNSPAGTEPHSAMEVNESSKGSGGDDDDGSNESVENDGESDSESEDESSPDTPVAKPAPPADLAARILNESRRGRTLGGEGGWGTVTSDMQELVQQIGIKQRRQEQDDRRARKISAWDELLDTGKQKKVKTKHEPENTKVNPFQTHAEVMRLNPRKEPGQEEERDNGRGRDQRADNRNRDSPHRPHGESGGGGRGGGGGGGFKGKGGGFQGNGGGYKGHGGGFKGKDGGYKGKGGGGFKGKGSDFKGKGGGGGFKGGPRQQ